MADQFDLEQGIMNCWMVTSDLDVLFEELVENTEGFNRDKASNFVLGLNTIYEAKFEKLFRTFESFLKEYYRVSKLAERLEQEVQELREEAYLTEEANMILAAESEQPETVSLDQLFDEEEAALQEEQRQEELSLIEDEQAPI